MTRLTHDPVLQGCLKEEQWLADVIGGMLRRSQQLSNDPANVYSQDRMEDMYGKEMSQKLIELYEAARSEVNHE